MEKMYKVFKVDICFEEYASDECLVGAESKQDLINHLHDIFPDYETIVQDEYDVEEYNQPIGTTVVIPRFSDSEYKAIVSPRSHRICEVKNLFTDLPYEVITSYGYIE